MADSCSVQDHDPVPGQTARDVFSGDAMRKSDDEIRQHIRDLETTLIMPCTCFETAHSEECQQGGRMILAAIGELKWAIGDKPEHQSIVDKIHAATEKFRRRPFVGHPS